MKMRPAVFLDRDGVICYNRSDYVKSLDEFVFLPGALAALHRLAALPHAIVVVSNQSAIGRGLVSRQIVDAINQQMVAEITAHGGRVDAIHLCPHRPDEACSCRKPRPGLLLRAAEEMHLDLAQSYVVGDALADVQAALAVGACPILVLTGRGRTQARQLSHNERPGVKICEDLGEAVTWITQREYDTVKGTAQG